MSSGERFACALISFALFWAAIMIAFVIGVDAGDRGCKQFIAIHQTNKPGDDRP